MRTTIEEMLLPQWTQEGWASYGVPLGPKGLTWTATARRPVPDPDPVRLKPVDAMSLYTEELQRRYEKVGIGLLGPCGDLGGILVPTSGLPPRQPGQRPGATAGEPYEYAEVSISNVSRIERKLAAATIVTACSELSLRAQAVGFFGLRLSGERALFDNVKALLGRIYRGQVWLAFNLDPQQTVLTAAHETRHRWQNEHDWHATHTIAEGERDAEVYANAFFRRQGSQLLAA